jgi:hypothetical protein
MIEDNEVLPKEMMYAETPPFHGSGERNHEIMCLIVALTTHYNIQKGEYNILINAQRNDISWVNKLPVFEAPSNTTAAVK